MAQYVKRSKADKIVLYFSKKEGLNYFVLETKRAKSKAFWSIALMFISPFAGMTFFFYSFSTVFWKILLRFFKNKDYVVFYDNYYKNVSANVVVSVVGYEVYEDELKEHLAIIGEDMKIAAKKLGQKQKMMMLPKNHYRHVGIDHKLLTTHILMLGKTGAGKTESIRSLTNDILKAGGGNIFIDGKADEKMLQEFFAQAERLGRETSRLVINFLKPQDMGESNSMSILNILHPIKIIEFLASLVKKGDGGDGNAEHFFEKGKAMLFPIIANLYIRDKLFKEGINFDKLSEYQTPLNMTILYVSAYSMLRDANEIIAKNRKLSSMVNNLEGFIVTEKELEYVEGIVEYMTRYSSKIPMLKEEINVDYGLLLEMYTSCYKLLKGYFSMIWNQFDVYLPLVAKTIYIMGCENGKKFFDPENYANCYSINDIREFYKELKDAMGAKDVGTVFNFMEKYKLEQHGFDEQSIAMLKNGLTKPKSSIEDPPADAIQQHSYAQQQWPKLFTTFAMYKHIFGSSEGDIEPVDLLQNNRFLYVLLPPLEQDRPRTEILGKVLIMAVKEVAALALGGEKISLHNTIKNIYRDKFTPKPFFLFVLDEYGAYPVDGIDTILAQVRSLNIGTIISIQDYVSLKTQGTSETAQKRALANLSKIFYKVEDQDVIKWVQEMVMKVKVIENELAMDEEENLVSQSKVSMKEQASFDPQILRDFDKGFCVFQLGGGETGTIYVHTFFRGGEPKNVFVKRFAAYDYDIA